MIAPDDDDDDDDDALLLRLPLLLLVFFFAVAAAAASAPATSPTFDNPPGDIADRGSTEGWDRGDVVDDGDFFDLVEEEDDEDAATAVGGLSAETVSSAEARADAKTASSEAFIAAAMESRPPPLIG